MRSNVGPYRFPTPNQILRLARIRKALQKNKIEGLQPIVPSSFVINVEMIKNENVVFVVHQLAAAAAAGRPRGLDVAAGR